MDNTSFALYLEFMENIFGVNRPFFVNRPVPVQYLDEFLKMLLLISNFNLLAEPHFRQPVFLMAR